MTHKYANTLQTVFLGILLVMGFSLWLVGGAALASPLAPALELKWWTVDGGGALNAPGLHYQLSGTIGQPDASAPATVGSYRLSPGFWPGAVGQYEVFLPVIKK